ncbi:MAG: hypothetical protein ACMUEM_01280 [Flavobacteriales bacterium AspAUS03]
MVGKSLEARKWDAVIAHLTVEFSPQEKISLNGILFLIGVQELGKGPKKFKKDDKINIMHIAICRLLEPFDYYVFKGRDTEGWPHYELREFLPALKPGEQSILIKKAIIRYFDEEHILDDTFRRLEQEEQILYI